MEYKWEGALFSVPQEVKVNDKTVYKVEQASEFTGAMVIHKNSKRLGKFLSLQSMDKSERGYYPIAWIVVTSEDGINHLLAVPWPEYEFLTPELNAKFKKVLDKIPLPIVDNITCPKCTGKGIVLTNTLSFTSCPLCQGKGTLNIRSVIGKRAYFYVGKQRGIGTIVRWDPKKFAWRVVIDEPIPNFKGNGVWVKIPELVEDEE